MPQPKSSKSAARSTAKGAARTSGKRAGAGKTPARKAAAPSSADAQAARDEALRQHLGELRDLLSGGVMLTAARVQETMDDAVRRGKMTRRDAEELARGLMDTGRRQSFDLLAEIEALLGRSKGDLGTASAIVRGGTDRVLREVDKVRRSAGVGAPFPILGYDELTAAQVVARLADLSPSELRRVREHEDAGAARKTVLAGIEKRLRAAA